MQTLEKAEKSVEMDLSANPGPENIQSVGSREYLTIHAFDGRIITRISDGTQTDWSHEEESIPKNTKPELEISPDNEVLDSLSMESPQACQGETEELLTNLDKIPTSSGSNLSEDMLQSVLNICCQYCRKLKKPPVTSDQIANCVDPKEFFCCEDAWQSSDIWLKGGWGITEETMTDWDPAMQKDQRLEFLEIRRSYFEIEEGATMQYRLSDSDGNAKKDMSFPDIEITDCEKTVSLNVELAKLKSKTPLIKRYNSGKTFIMIFPDGTGQISYPSGRLAILVSAARSADWYYVVLEDKQDNPRIQAVFMKGGQGTCYHKNGRIWLNLTPQGGTYCTDTGVLKKNWSWLDNTNHVQAPPCQPPYLTLSPYLNVHIQSQEHIYLNYISGRCSVRLNVGVKSKQNQGKGPMLSEFDMLQRYLQQKSTEINVLLQKCQSLITYQKAVGQQKVKTPKSLISQKERRRLPTKKKRSAKKTRDSH